MHADCITPGTTGNVEPFLLGLLFLASFWLALPLQLLAHAPALG